MNILVVSQYFWPENFRINDLVTSLKERGHEIHVLTGKPNYPYGKFFKGYGFFTKFFDEYNGINIIRAPILPRYNGSSIYLVLNYISFVVSALLSSLFLMHKNFDVIFVYEPSPITVALPAIFIKKIKKKPLVLWVQDLWPESINASGSVKSVHIIKLVEYLVRFIYKRCDLLLAQSKAFIPSINKYSTAETEISYYPNYAEDLYKKKIDNKDNVNASLPEGFRVVFTGNVGVAQDFGTILNAVDILKDNPFIKWIIVGEGRQSDWVKKEVARRGLGQNVHLVGQHPLEEMPYFYANADVMLVTLKKDEILSYTIPGKVQSYMAAGKPIVGCLDGEGKRIIEEAKAGLMAGAGDAKLLAENILALSKVSTSVLEQYEKNAFDFYMNNFSKDSLVTILENTLMEICTK